MQMRLGFAIFTSLAVGCISPQQTTAQTAPATATGSQNNPNPEALRAATELVSMILKETLDQMSAEAWRVTEATLSDAKPDKDTLAALRVEFDRFQKQFMSDVLKDSGAIYARHFTAAELLQLSAFYRTAVGEKTIKTMPQLTSESMSAQRLRVQELQAQMFLALRKILRERSYVK